MKVYIWSFEHDAWWRPDRCGYTTVAAEAGQYELKTAQQIVTDANIACDPAHPHEQIRWGIGTPREMKVLLFDSETPVTIPKGAEITVSVEVQNPDGTVDVLFLASLLQLPVDCRVVRLVTT